MSNASSDFVANLQCSARTDVGMRRANNQDSHTVVLAEDEASWRVCGHFLMVADGMGAHAAGELASKLAVDNVPHLYRHYRDLPPAEALRRAISEASGEIHRRGLANQEFFNMGTTASILVLLPVGALVGHVGDSRVYRLRDERLEQLTFDHSLVWELQASGQLSANTDLARAVPKNVITRSLGPHPNVAVDIEGPFPIQVGDTFLLCSDGLSNQVPDHELGTILANLTPEEASAALVDLANLRGGPDNVTVLVAKVVGEGLVTATSGEQPRPAGNRSRRFAINPAVWVVMGICCFLALILSLASLYIRQPVDAAPAANPQTRRGPYRREVCKPGDEFVQTLSGVVHELRTAAEESQWKVNWHQFETYQRAAEQAASSRRYADAIRSYATALSFMMNELRNQQRQQAGDSSIRY
ncbi:MAG: protein phosphatase 2C domain-containing protein [Planctomycetota bacterium]|nr:protein phosphatase 2C domain-containing protein [Planctomycetota bacterium]